ncbi:MAG TPA: hypothetical protein VEA69_09950 [Tepidisphaeraceae bacterium]|nr:hypothetical protein [Tepidisphaeraceae bacterium]
MPRLLPALILLPALALAAENKAPPLDRPEKISYLDNGVIRLGVNLDLGGAITHLSRSDKPDQNVINSFDWGRQVQMSHYAGPIPFEPGGKKPAEHWNTLGWNPIQSGDCFGHRSKVVEHVNDGKRLRVKCVPMQWPLDNEPGECTFEWEISLDGNASNVRATLVNARTDKTPYPGRHQELPAVYTNAPWHRLMTYSGDKPFTNGELTHQPPKFPWGTWRATERWTALVDDGGFGVGLISPETFRFDGGFAGKTGKGGAKDNPTGYVTAVSHLVLDHDITHSFRFTLVLGTIEEIRKRAYELAPRPAPPDWRFEDSRHYWYYVNATDAGWPIKGELRIDLSKKRGPMLASPTTFFAAAEAPKLYIECAAAVANPNARVFWARHDRPRMADDMSMAFKLPANDGKFHTVAVEVGKSEQWTGHVTDLRVDPGPGGVKGDEVRIKRIWLGK